jgi:hypothetical protein
MSLAKVLVQLNLEVIIELINRVVLTIIPTIIPITRGIHNYLVIPNKN